MKTIIVKCATCNSDVTKSLKEHTRRIKIGAMRFFCNLRCSGLATKQNPSLNGWNGSPENLALLIKLRQNNTIYSAEDHEIYTLFRSTLKRNKENDLDIPYLKKLWTIQDGKCALSNIPMRLGANGNINTQASIDRIDSSMGYVKGNVQFVVCAMNYAKGSASNTNALAFIELIIEHASANRTLPEVGILPDLW